MTFKIKRSHNILGTTYKTKFLKKLDWFMGLCKFKEKEIHIAPHDSLYELKHTLLHEIIHATCHESGANQTQVIELEEVLCTVLATAILKNYDITNY